MLIYSSSSSARSQHVVIIIVIRYFHQCDGLEGGARPCHLYRYYLLLLLLLFCYCYYYYYHHHHRQRNHHIFYLYYRMLEQHRRAKCIITCLTTLKRMAIILASRSGVLIYTRATNYSIQRRINEY